METVVTNYEILDVPCKNYYILNDAKNLRHCDRALYYAIAKITCFAQQVNYTKLHFCSKVSESGNKHLFPVSHIKLNNIKLDTWWECST